MPGVGGRLRPVDLDAEPKPKLEACEEEFEEAGDVGDFGTSGDVFLYFELDLDAIQERLKMLENILFKAEEP
jgi:hypothetical protein